MNENELWYGAQVLRDRFSWGMSPADAADSDIAMILGNESTRGLLAAERFVRILGKRVRAVILSGGSGYGTRFLRRHVRSEFPEASSWPDLDQLAEARIYERLRPGLGLGLPVEVEDCSRHTSDNFIRSKPHLLRLMQDCGERRPIKVAVFQVAAQRLRAQVAGREEWSDLGVEVNAVDFDRSRFDPVADLAGAVIGLYRLVGWKSRTPAGDTAGEVEVFSRYHPQIVISDPIRRMFVEVQAEFDRRLNERPDWRSVIESP